MDTFFGQSQTHNPILQFIGWSCCPSSKTIPKLVNTPNVSKGPLQDVGGPCVAALVANKQPPKESGKRKSDSNMAAPSTADFLELAPRSQKKIKAATAAKAATKAAPKPSTPASPTPPLSAERALLASVAAPECPGLKTEVPDGQAAAVGEGAVTVGGVQYFGKTKQQPVVTGASGKQVAATSAGESGKEIAATPSAESGKKVVAKTPKPSTQGAPVNDNENQLDLDSEKVNITSHTARFPF